MPIIRAGSLGTGNLKGADHGATISLILDHSQPGEGPRLHRHPYDENLGRSGRKAHLPTWR
jgi:hypothetical protein